jgi:hypothetical protein
MMLMMLILDLGVLYGWIVTFHNTSGDVKIGGSIIMSIITIATIAVHIRFAKGPSAGSEGSDESTDLLQPNV